MPAEAARDGGDGLRRELGGFGAVSMIVGIVIGSGIFLGVNRVAAGAGSPSLVVLVWVVGALLTLMGALTYAELGVLFPRAGGEYVFLREGLGSLLAFLSGWTAFTINLAGSAAALGIIFAEQLNAIKPDGFAPMMGLEWSTKLTASCLILLLATLNYFGLRLGGNVQKGLTVLKGGLMVLLAAAALLYLGDPATPRVDPFAFAYVADTPAQHGFSFAGFFGLAMVAALFAYDGWTNVVRLGSEIKQPQSTLPRAMVVGVGAVAVLYILLSLGYLNVLGFEGFASGEAAGVGPDRTVASNTARVLFGDGGQDLVATIILVSVLGSLNGITISGPRIYYAMARDRLFPRTFAGLNRHRVPGHALWGQALLAIAFLLAFDFYELTENVVFISFIFYALAAVTLVVLRRKHPDLPRAYKVPGYPYVPILFIVASLLFVSYNLVQEVRAFDLQHMNLLVGLAVVLAGIPVYAFYRARLVREAKEKGLPPPEPIFGTR